jgi:hypothetical protein
LPNGQSPGAFGRAWLPFFDFSFFISFTRLKFGDGELGPNLTHEAQRQFLPDEGDQRTKELGQEGNLPLGKLLS